VPRALTPDAGGCGCCGLAPDLSYDHQLPLDTILIGASRTRSSDSLVTDSASGATAFSCGIKTYNAAIGGGCLLEAGKQVCMIRHAVRDAWGRGAVDPQGEPCGTVLEAAKRQGYLTGTVATSRITHATPASFNAHVADRNSESDIAYQQIGNSPLQRCVHRVRDGSGAAGGWVRQSGARLTDHVRPWCSTTDIVMGGGRRFFLPTTQGGSRSDGRDLLAMAENTFGYRVITSRAEFDALPQDASAYATPERDGAALRVRVLSLMGPGRL
jgi:alkaline phosphatase